MCCLPSPDVVPLTTCNHLDWIVIIIITIELSEKHNAFQFNKLTATIFHTSYALYNHFFKVLSDYSAYTSYLFNSKTAEE